MRKGGNRGTKAASALAFASIVLLVSCNGKGPADNPRVTLEEVKSVMGEASGTKPGVLDFTQGEAEAIISYQYYDVDLMNYDDDMVADMAPKIEALYRKFKSLDRVVFKITTNNPVSGDWRAHVRLLPDPEDRRSDLLEQSPGQGLPEIGVRI